MPARTFIQKVSFAVSVAAPIDMSTSEENWGGKDMTSPMGISLAFMTANNIYAKTQRKLINIMEVTCDTCSNPKAVRHIQAKVSIPKQATFVVNESYSRSRKETRCIAAHFRPL